MMKDQEQRLLRSSPLRRIQDRRQRMDELEQDMQRLFSRTVQLPALCPAAPCNCACTAWTRAR
jgi:hypothetical protein